MELHVVGSSCGGPRNGKPAAGYLVLRNGRTLLLDCGPGVATALSGQDLSTLSAIVISHAHYDHCADLVVLGTWLVSAQQEGRGLPRIPVYFPPGSMQAVVDYAHSYPFFVGKNRSMFDHVFVASEYEPDMELVVDGISVKPVGPVAHPCPTWALRLSDGDAVLTYSGDSAYTDVLVEAARDADLFLCDAYGPDFSHPSHMSAEESGRLAAAAGVNQLVLTHLLEQSGAYWSRLIEAAQRYFPGPVDVAVPGRTYRVKRND